MDLEAFRQEVHEFIETNCPQSMRNRVVTFDTTHEVYSTDDAKQWLDINAERGWTAPTWPTEYDGGGLGYEENQILQQEMASLKALPPSMGMGLAMIGPTLLEYGTDEQKQRHLPKIVSGEVTWCQGYSEPGSGS
ncbi:MAG: acyl-CoA dehydrogenase, partial [Gammaproteobacteria bacterium]|nr:acyl-CoA dehydrogenase [Gammaproteobacteria bacterium]